jgi:hypothetical protein
MHPVLSHFKFKSFEGKFPIHGTERDVEFIDDRPDGTTVLAIHGLNAEDVFHILHQLKDGLLAGKDAEQKGAVKASASGVSEIKVAAPKPEPVKTATVPAKKPEPVKAAPKQEPKPEPEQLELPTDDEDAKGATGELTDEDVETLKTTEKLRGFVELVWARGFRDEGIVEIALKMKGDVPALVQLDAKPGGDFAKRMRNAIRMYQEMYVNGTKTDAAQPTA